MLSAEHLQKSLRHLVQKSPHQSAPKIAMLLIAAIVATLAVANVAEAGYTELGHAVHDTGAYYDDHYGSLGYTSPLAYGTPYAAYYGNPSGTYSYWGLHGPTVVQQNAASLHDSPIVHGDAHLYAPYSSLYGAYGPVKTTVVQANVASSLAHHWGYPAAYGAYGYGYGYDHSNYLTGKGPVTKYLL
uniref:Uncharacterized protein n=1 Tax=Anopheles farauti TaxID=69004 RepID=A0A182Q846_9DIPT